MGLFGSRRSGPEPERCKESIPALILGHRQR
jgi:hypothetical protein